ncbi:hypothetical protein AB0F91_37390 [Amycolatopsis sp. NPDC023774]|uniref:hypothetical protein n=1 Tax=Amycolatopsis sp. NPDC023774 TaxID=3155015 RepID=UPI0033E56A0B
MGFAVWLPLASSLRVPEATMAQRISRAEQRHKAAGTSFDLPPAAEQAAWLGVMLHVLHLVVNEGSTATPGAVAARLHDAARARATLEDGAGGSES